MKSIVLRADGSNTIGLGHIMRCIAIAQMVKDSFRVKFATHGSSERVLELITEHGFEVCVLEKQLEIDFVGEFDAVLLDGYWFRPNYVESIKAAGKRVVQVDDLAKGEYFADILINHAPGVSYDKTKLYNCRHLLIGPDYALLREEFLASCRDRQSRKELVSCTLSFGGSDPHNYSLLFAESILKQLPAINLNIVLGTAYTYKNELNRLLGDHKEGKVKIRENLSAAEFVELLQNTSLYICAASTVVYEALATGVPTACIKTAENQTVLYKGLIASKAVYGLGETGDFSAPEFSTRLLDCFSQFLTIAENANTGPPFIDGLSGKRIKEAILTLWN